LEPQHLPEQTPLFDKITYPADLKRLEPDQLPELCAELRKVIMDTVKVTGGHLGSGMGVVELTVALHYVFDFAEDRLVMDVGHQAYPHKLLTGRKQRFHTLRQKGGLSGFTNRFESKYDVYNCGHAGTATSASLGIAIGDRILGRDRHVVTLVGDAAMGCGVAFEALNHSGATDREKLLVVLNDNRWSIAQTVGALTRYLTKIRTGNLYNQAKKKLHHLIQSIPVIGKDLDERMDVGLEAVRHLVAPGHMFEALGLGYYGPVDGHDTGELLDVLTRVKDLEGVKLLHVRTEKGRGVPGSQERHDRAHAAQPQPKLQLQPEAEARPPDKQQPKPQSKPQAKPQAKPEPKVVPMEPKVVPPARRKRRGRAWTAWFGEAIEELAGQNDKLMAITAAMPDGTGLMQYRQKFPERFIDAGIAEQHAVAMASGLATAGMRPVVAIYSTFLQRGYDQIFQEVALQKLPVMFAMDRSGLVGEDGYSHNGVFDIAYLRTFPNMVLMAPKDGPELRAMLAFGLTLDGPCAVRYARGNAPEPGELLARGQKSRPIALGRSEILRKGRDGAILAYGHMVRTALEAADILAQQGTAIEVVNARFAKPLDKDGILALGSRHDHVLTLEDHALMGGFGSAVLELVAAEGPVRARFEPVGIPDRFIPHATPGQAYQDAGIDASSVAARLAARLTQKPPAKAPSPTRV
jgi:1-deoxy-D-xylulose-5-phosphate synthase